MPKKKSVQVEDPALNPNQKIERKKISELKVNPLNAEIYPDEDIEDLKESILNNNGKILVPLVITPDGVIISGHRRYKAAIDLGIDEVNVIVEDVKDDDMEFRMIQYNVYRRKKYSEILHEVDRLNEYLGKNQGRRTDLLDSGEKLDVNAQIAKIVGLSPTTVSNLKTIRSYSKEYIDKIDEGKTSIVKAFAACKEGIKTEGKKKSYYVPVPMFNDDFIVYNKSCQNMYEIEDNSVQLVFSSSPYYKMRIYKAGKAQLGQEKTPDQFVKNLVSVLKDCYRVLKPEGSFFLNIGDCKVDGQSLNVPHKVLFELLKQQKYFHIQTIIWEKTNATPVQNFKYLQPSYEFIFHLTKSMEYTYNEDIGRPFLLSHLPQFLKQIDKEELEKLKPFHQVYGEQIPFDAGILYDIWTYHDFLKTSSFQQSIEMLDGDDPHPAQMNSIIPILPILLTTNENDIVLDPFSGWATTGVVALQWGRRYRGYEISQEYFEGSIKKLSKFSITKPIEQAPSK